MPINNFQQLEKDYTHSFKDSGKTKYVEQSISSVLGGVRFVTNILDLYLIRVKDTLIELSKQASDDISSEVSEKVDEHISLEQDIKDRLGVKEEEQLPPHLK